MTHPLPIRGISRAAPPPPVPTRGAERFRPSGVATLTRPDRPHVPTPEQTRGRDHDGPLPGRPASTRRAWHSRESGTSPPSPRAAAGLPAERQDPVPPPSPTRRPEGSASAHTLPLGPGTPARDGYSGPADTKRQRPAPPFAERSGAFVDPCVDFALRSSTPAALATVVMPGVGLEPTSPCGQRILSPPRLPISPPGRSITI